MYFAITFLDGEKGILKYRGYGIEEIAEKSSFIEASYLTFYGKLPSASELKAFEERISSFDDVPEGIKAMIKCLPKGCSSNGGSFIEYGFTFCFLSGYV